MNDRTIVAPSILSGDFSDVASDIGRIEESGADWIHLDVMDGSFVPNITFGPKMVADIRARTRLPLDVHLMIDDPGRYVRAFVDAGADYVTFHIEAAVHAHRVVQQIRSAGAKPGVALVPSTPASAVDELLDEVEMILVMTVNPGFGGQSLIPRTVEKLASIAARRRELGATFLLEVDGGINPETAALVRAAGCDVLVSGSAFFAADDAASYCTALSGRTVA
jgi:ribulose-phosphate 3-epimerase